MLEKERIVKALGEGIYILIKYGFIILLILLAIYQYQDLNQRANNGNNAAAALNEYIKAGYLPNFQNGKLPLKKGVE